MNRGPAILCFPCATRRYDRESGEEYSALASCQLRYLCVADPAQMGNKTDITLKEFLLRCRTLISFSMEKCLHGALFGALWGFCYEIGLQCCPHSTFILHVNEVDWANFFCFLQKKLPMTALSQTMQDGGWQLGEESLIGWVTIKFQHRLSVKYNV